MGYLGIGTCLKKLGQALNNPESMCRTLQWQRDINGEAAKIAVFKAEVGSLLGFQVFLMMREGTTMVTLLHSTAKYFSISSATSRYQGQYIGFVGDRLPTRKPGPVLLPATKGWEWVTKSVRGNGEDMVLAYATGANYGKLWTPTRDSTEVSKTMPCLLILPPLFIKLIRNTKKALMPHEVWTLIKAYMDTPGLPQECRDACTLVMDWCLVAAQASRPDKDSYLAFSLDAVTEHNHDMSLAVWLNTQLDSTLERQPEQGGAGGATGMTPTYLQGQTLDANVITWAIGQGLALGYQHLLPHRGAPSAATGGGQASKAGELAYSTNDVCAMMVYSSINDPVDCQVIWTIFSKKKKNVEACHQYLMKGMTEYAYERRISIDGDLPGTGDNEVNLGSTFQPRGGHHLRPVSGKGIIHPMLPVLS
jgi:hypothetical protein